MQIAPKMEKKNITENITIIAMAQGGRAVLCWQYPIKQLELLH